MSTNLNTWNTFTYEHLCIMHRTTINYAEGICSFPVKLMVFVYNDVLIDLITRAGWYGFGMNGPAVLD